MMNSDLISIVMPIRNAELYLEECLNSILNQTEQNWELLAINDHSTDTTSTILQQFSEKDNRIKTFNNTGKGIIEALRFAYSKSIGNFITRMDADDIMPIHKLQTLKTALLTQGEGHVATGLVEYFADYPMGNGYLKYQNWLNTLTKTGSNFKELYKECSIPSPCWMVSRTDFEACEAFQPNLYPEDYDLAFRFYKYGMKVIPSNDILHLWRDYQKRTSRTDDNYADNTFLSIKMYYFLTLEYQKEKTIILWGAGKKGKEIAKILIAKNIPFQWVCNNPKKIGKHIYDTLLISEKKITQSKGFQFIISVANTTEQQEIKIHLQQIKAIDKFFFC